MPIKYIKVPVKIIFTCWKDFTRDITVTPCTHSTMPALILWKVARLFNRIIYWTQIYIINRRSFFSKSGTHESWSNLFESVQIDKFEWREVMRSSRLSGDHLKSPNIGCHKHPPPVTNSPAPLRSCWQDPNPFPIRPHVLCRILMNECDTIATCLFWPFSIYDMIDDVDKISL